MRDPPLLKPLHPHNGWQLWKKLTTILVISSIVLFAWGLWDTTQPSFFRDKRIKDIETPTTLKAPVTSTHPHLDSRFLKWMIPNRTQDELYTMLQNAPRNPKTGRQFIMVSVLNQGMIDFSLNMYCSMRIAQIPREYHVFVALDNESFAAVEKVGAQVVLLDHANFTKNAVNNRHIIDFYDIVKVRPTVLHLFCLWNFEVIICDTDIVFLENPLPLFNDNADFEVQCDSKVFYRIPYNQNPVPWQANLGFFKLHPTPAVMSLFPIWMERMYTSPKMQDQSALRRILKPFKTQWLNNDTVIVDTRNLFMSSDESLSNITVRFLDPMYICNAGGLYQEAKEDWKLEAKLRGIKRPKLVHYFHLGSISRKYGLMKSNDMWFITALDTCISSQTHGAATWPLWND